MKSVTHVIGVPPLTDVQEMLANYKGLFNALNVPNEIPFQAQSGFSHPIPEENEKLTNEFFTTMMIVKQLTIDKVHVKLVDARVSQKSITFVFHFQEA